MPNVHNLAGAIRVVSRPVTWTSDAMFEDLDWGMLSLAALMAFSFLFFYFADVQVEILTLPGLIFFVAR
jgi:hypothetical protein